MDNGFIIPYRRRSVNSEGGTQEGRFSVALEMLRPNPQGERVGKTALSLARGVMGSLKYADGD